MSVNTKKLAGKVAVVTGASKGIGAAIARQLADEGAAVVVNYSSGKEGADRVVADVTRNGGRAVAVQANVSNPTEIRRLFSAATEAFGRLDAAFNNGPGDVLWLSGRLAARIRWRGPGRARSPSPCSCARTRA